MPSSSSSSSKNNTQPNNGTGLVIAIIILLLIIAAGVGYYFYTKNRPKSTPLPFEQDTSTVFPPQEQNTAPSDLSSSTAPSSLPVATSTAPSYANWKTYIYRAPGGGGFSIKYPPGFAVGQERTKEEAYFTVYPSPNPLNKPEVMQIYYEGNGNVRFSQNDNGDEWPLYGQVVQSFEKLK